MKKTKYSVFGCVFALVVIGIVWFSIGFISVWSVRGVFYIASLFSKTSDPIISKTGLHKSNKDAFMKSCYSGSNYEYCSCVFDQFKNKFTLQEITDESQRLINGQKPSQITIDAVKYCSK